MNKEQPSGAAGGNAGSSATVNLDLSNVQVSAMLYTLVQQVDNLNKKLEVCEVPEKGKEARCDDDFSWSKDGTKKNHSRHVKVAELLEKAEHLLKGANGQPMTPDGVSSLSAIAKEGVVPSQMYCVVMGRPGCRPHGGEDWSH